jgi:hypothetical protein
LGHVSGALPRRVQSRRATAWDGESRLVVAAKHLLLSVYTVHICPRSAFGKTSKSGSKR